MAFVCLCAFKLKQIRWAWAPAVLPRLHGAPHQTLFLFTFMTTPCPALFEGHFYPFSIRGSLAFHLFTFFFFFFFSLFFFFLSLLPVFSPFLISLMFSYPRNLPKKFPSQKTVQRAKPTENVNRDQQTETKTNPSTSWNHRNLFLHVSYEKEVSHTRRS